MKSNFLFYPLVALSVAGLTGCAEDFLSRQTTRECVVSAEIGNVQTRTCVDPTEYLDGEVGILWMPSDKIGVFDSSVQAEFSNMSQTNTGQTSFKGTLIGDTPKYAYYPFDERNNGKEVNDLVGTLPAVQDVDSRNAVLQGDYKISNSATADGEETRFTFSHLFSLIRFTIDASETTLEGESLRWISMSVNNGRNLAGEFTFDASQTGGNVQFSGTALPEVRMNWIDSPLLSGGSSYTAYMTVNPDVKTDDSLTVTVCTDRHKAVFTTKAKTDLAADYIYTFPMTLKMYNDPKFGWDVKDVVEPVMDSFEFTVAANQGKILAYQVESASSGASAREIAVTTQKLEISDHDVKGIIPYLYDFNLVPTFSVPEGVKVKVNGIEQVSGETPQDFSKPIVYTLESADGTTADYTVNVSNTGLPVVVVSQSSSISKGSWVSWIGNLKVRSKESEWATDDKVAVYDVNGKYVLGEAASGVRLRGNSTQSFPKKPFAIKLDKKAAIGDMPASKRWVLLANWIDASMIRNNTSFAIAHAMESAWNSGAIEKGMPWNPHGTNVELVIDGRHVGNYYLCEQIKVEKNRLNIKDIYEDLVKDGKSATFATCGYLIECDDNYDENYKFTTSRRGIPIMLKDDVNDEILSQIQTKINRIEGNLVNGNYTAAYTELDINSLIDQWIVFELTMNDEYKHPKSVYLYMDGGDSKLCAGPVWDFDYMTFPNSTNISSLNSRYGGSEGPKSSTAWLYSHSNPSSVRSDTDAPYMWYPLLFKDATFRKAVQDRWKVIYPYLQQVSAQIMQNVDKNNLSWNVNSKMWPLAFNRSSVVSWFPAFSGDEAFTSYDKVVNNLNQMYTQRLQWMNNAITNGNFVTTAK